MDFVARCVIAADVSCIIQAGRRRRGADTRHRSRMTPQRWGAVPPLQTHFGALCFSLAMSRIVACQRLEPRGSTPCSNTVRSGCGAFIVSKSSGIKLAGQDCSDDSETIRECRPSAPTSHVGVPSVACRVNRISVAGRCGSHIQNRDEKPMGSIKKKRRKKIAQHKRRKQLKANRHKNK